MSSAPGFCGSRRQGSSALGTDRLSLPPEARSAGGGEARAASPVFLREHPEHPEHPEHREHRGGKARREAAPLRLEEGAVALCPWCWAPALEGRGAE